MQKLFWWNLNEGEKYQRLKHMVWLYVTTSIILFYKCDWFIALCLSMLLVVSYIIELKRLKGKIGQ